MGMQTLCIPLEGFNTSFKLVSGGDYVNQLIKIALSDCSHNHPYLKEIGLDMQVIFGNNDLVVKENIVKIFNVLEKGKMAKLRSLVVSREGSKVIVQIKYYNFELDEDVYLNSSLGG